MFLQSQGELALGSRFKALSEHCYRIANAAYRATGIEFDAHWFPVLRYVQVKGPGTVTQIAQAIGQTHSAVSQLATRLVREGWLVRKSDRADARRSLLDLPLEAERRLADMGPIWTAIRRATNALLARHAGDLSTAMAALEKELSSERVLQDILARHKEEKLLEIEREEITMAEMLERLRNMVMSAGELNLRVFFERAKSRRELVLAFLSVLELVRTTEVKLFQRETFGDIIARAGS